MFREETYRRHLCSSIGHKQRISRIDTPNFITCGCRMYYNWARNYHNILLTLNRDSVKRRKNHISKNILTIHNN